MGQEKKKVRRKKHKLKRGKIHIESYLILNGREIGKLQSKKQILRRTLDKKAIDWLEWDGTQKWMEGKVLFRIEGNDRRLATDSW